MQSAIVSSEWYSWLFPDKIRKIWEKRGSIPDQKSYIGCFQFNIDLDGTKEVKTVSRDWWRIRRYWIPFWSLASQLSDCKLAF